MTYNLKLEGVCVRKKNVTVGTGTIREIPSKEILKMFHPLARSTRMNNKFVLYWRVQRKRIVPELAHSSLWLRQTIDLLGDRILLVPVPYSASTNKSCASHFNPVRTRILWLLAAATCCLSFSLASPRYRASLPLLPFPYPFTLPTHPSAVAFLYPLSSERERDCRELHKTWKARIQTHPWI